MHRKISYLVAGLVMLSATTLHPAFAGDDCIFIRDRDQRNLCKDDCMFIVDSDLRNLCKGVTSETKKLPAQHSERWEQDSYNTRDQRWSGYEDTDFESEEEGDGGGYERDMSGDDERPKNRRGKAGRR